MAKPCTAAIPALRPLVQCPRWQELQALSRDCADLELDQLFKQNPSRAAAFTLEAAGWRMDFSKQRINAAVLDLLLELARARELPRRMAAMFAGEAINTTEQRAALHVALRAPQAGSPANPQADAIAAVHGALRRMQTFCQQLRSGPETTRIRTVVNIGVGGSHLGPRMAFDALRFYSDRSRRFRFLANIDGTDFAETTRDLDPASTLFIVCSKSFTTLETMHNARSARDWCVAALGEDAVARHFAAVTARTDLARDFGISDERIFPMWDWVGGRYSMDSAIGLSTMLAVGPEHFSDMLAGFHAMDEHFRTAPLRENLPVIMGLLAVWNINFLDLSAQAILPYSQYLQQFPAYLQQLAMESNGKSVTLGGQAAEYATCPIYWGEVGTNGQHSFYQLLHQGTPAAACDFIGFARPLNPLGAHHDLLMANLFAQSRALAFGGDVPCPEGQYDSAAQSAHRKCPGNRPSTTLLAQQLTPRTLGALVALYEHSIFVQGLLWDINSFDQWGVQLGKNLANAILEEIRGSDTTDIPDSSTDALIAWYRKFRQHG